MDDFTKSLGKQMNLVLKRMEMTERVRTKLRDQRRQEALMEEEKMKNKKQMEFERIEKNREWRQKKISEGTVSNGFDDLRVTLGCTPVGLGRCLEWMVRSELLCCSCQGEMFPPAKIYQCAECHNICQDCKYGLGIKTCPICTLCVMGRNIAAENMSAIVFSRYIITGELKSITEERQSICGTEIRSLSLG